MADVFGDNETRVIDFMGAVDKERDALKQHEDIKDSDVYKLRLLNNNREKMRDYCFHKVCKKINRDAIPLGDCYKNANIQDIDDAFDEFIRERCPQGLVYYIREGLKKGSPFAKKLIESVEAVVKEAFDEREINVEDYSASDMEFDPNKDADDKKIEIVTAKLSAPEISQKLYDMTKQTAVDEISRAKKNKEQLDRLQNELANDIQMNNRTAIESVLEARGYTDKKMFTPTIFEGLNIGNINMLEPKFESGELASVNIMDALDPITNAFEESANNDSATEDKFATLEELAFIESVQEYTSLNMIKALKLESFNKRDMITMADKFAARR